jgi:hypothetical protein
MLYNKQPVRKHQVIAQRMAYATKPKAIMLASQ